MTLLALAALAALAGPVAPPPAELPPLPSPPVRADDSPQDCRAKAGLVAGDVLGCDAVALPPSYAAFLEEYRVYSGQLGLRLVAAEAVASADARASARAIAWRDDEIERLRNPPPVPFFERPFVILAGGVLLGGAAVAVGGWAIGQASQ